MDPIWREPRPPAAPAPLAEENDVDDVVVGAGLTGLCTALLLARAGRRVRVLEARYVGGLTSGATTGKVSLLQGTRLSHLLRTQSAAVVRAYLEANREGMAWLLRFCEDHDVRYDVRDAITYAANDDELPAVLAEHAAAGSLGLPVRWSDEVEAPFAVRGATVLPEQAQIDPVQVLQALATQVRAHGGTVEEGIRVRSVSRFGRPAVRTGSGAEIRCGHVVLATGTPVLDRGLYFAKLEARRSYLLALRSADPPRAMMISAGDPVHSVRDVTGRMDANLLVGGYGHVVGRTDSEAGRLEELRAWARRQFTDAVETYAWSAQDYASHDGIPYVGRLPRGFGHVYFASGYDKWGLANASAAALRIAGGILGSEPSWGRPLSRRITRPRGAWNLVTRNAQVVSAGLSGVVAAQAWPVEPDPAPGEGSVGRSGRNPVPVAVSSGDPACAVSGICTHLGGVLHWNDAEGSWDCPLHGSRFTPDGQVIEGPASRPLDRVEVPRSGEAWNVPGSGTPTT